MFFQYNDPQPVSRDTTTYIRMGSSAVGFLFILKQQSDFPNDGPSKELWPASWGIESDQPYLVWRQIFSVCILGRLHVLPYRASQPNQMLVTILSISTKITIIVIIGSTHILHNKGSPFFPVRGAPWVCTLLPRLHLTQGPPTHNHYSAFNATVDPTIQDQAQEPGEVILETSVPS